MSDNQITNLLSVVLIIMVCVLFLLLGAYLILRTKEKRKTKKKKVENYLRNDNKGENNTGKGSIKTKEYSKESIFSFMKFDKIEDDMIIKKDGTKFVMVVECQGINYDLMSAVEKNSVEQGFIQFLNTLKHPIQIYTQTRTVNLGASLATYKEKLKEIENRYVTKQLDYNAKANSGNYSGTDLMNERLEVVRERNLYEYGKDIIMNTERMNLNKNILRMHYYIIISYTPEEINNPNIEKSELRDIAFNELYTRCRSMITALSVCSINSKILNSNELAELLYMAYNRDDADIYQLDRALDAKYDELYVTAEDVLDKRKRVLDKKIEEEALIKANEKLNEAVQENEKEREVREKEQNLEELISKMAKMIIDENEQLVGSKVAKIAKEKIDEKDEGKGGN